MSQKRAMPTSSQSGPKSSWVSMTFQDLSQLSPRHCGTWHDEGVGFIEGENQGDFGADVV